MVHAIDDSLGTPAMAYTGKRPWHNLGTKVETHMTVAEALLLGGLDYKVEKLPLHTRLPEEKGGQVIKVEGKYATVRMDTKKPLGVVGKNYHVVQNVEALSFFDSALGEGAAAIETVGALDKGRKTFMLAKIPEMVEVVKGDPLEQFLLFTNSHDGTSAVTCAFTPIRVVCQNTLSVALAQTKRSVKIRHTRNARDQLKIASEVLAANKNYWHRIKAALTYMAKRDVSRKDVENFVEDLFPDNSNLNTSKVKASTLVDRHRDAVRRAFELSPGAEIAGATAYGLFQATTWYIDHTKENPKKTQRWETSLFGNGAKLRQRAFEAALSL